MGNITAGANPDELDRLAAILDRSADRVRSIQRSLSSQIHSSPWHGRNAQQFRHEWSGEHRRAIDESIAFLDEQSTALRRHADDQRRVSGAGTLGSDPGHAGRSGASPDAGKVVNSMFDLVDIFTGATPSPFGFGASIGLGLYDLIFDQDGYGDEYHGLESVMDGLGIAAAAVGLGGLIVIGVAGGVAAAPAAVLVVGVAAIAGGLIKGVDLFLDTSVGYQVLTTTSRTLNEGWRMQARLLEKDWGYVAS